jgi:CheY-like chemotaxis protein
VTLRILIVDDSEMARAELKQALAGGAFAVAEAESGAAALKMLETAAFDVLVTDVHMPGMTGIELCEALQQRSDLKRPVCLVVSTETNADTKKRAKAAGVAGWIIKPCGGAVVLATIQAVLSRQPRP